MTRTAEQCSLVVVLNATVAFAAAYTIPGVLEILLQAFPLHAPKAMHFGNISTVILMIHNRDEWKKNRLVLCCIPQSLFERPKSQTFPCLVWKALWNLLFILLIVLERSRIIVDLLSMRSESPLTLRIAKNL